MKRTGTIETEINNRKHWKIPFFIIVFVSLLAPSSFSADDPSSKAVRRNSSDSSLSTKDQKRVALVIGNSHYKVRPLQNPDHDAEDISGVLRTFGFTVQTKTNVNHREMEEAVNKFVQEIQEGDVALFYFSGHGVQVKGENYLIPIDDSIQMEADLRFKTLNAGLVLAKMEESRNRANIVILDACRNNPFKGLFRSTSTGLSKMDAPKGTLIAYATSPDAVAADGTGRNSPYTKHLIEALKVKDITIEQALKLVARAVNRETGGQQIPWIASSMLDDIYFNASSPTPTRPPTVSLPPPRREPEPITRPQIQQPVPTSTGMLARPQIPAIQQTPTPISTRIPEGNWLVILGSFPKVQSDRAEQRANLCQASGYGARVIDTDQYPKLTPGLWAVILGPYSKDQALDMRNKTRSIVRDAYVKEWK